MYFYFIILHTKDFIILSKILHMQQYKFSNCVKKMFVVFSDNLLSTIFRIFVIIAVNKTVTQIYLLVLYFMQIWTSKI